MQVKALFNFDKLNLLCSWKFLLSICLLFTLLVEETNVFENCLFGYDTSLI